MDKIKIHLRVTKEVEVTMEEARLLAEKGNEKIGGIVDEKALNDLLSRISKETGADSYAESYIPAPWLTADTGLACRNDIDI